MARGTRKREEDGEQLGCLMRRGKTARRLSFNRLQRACTLRKKNDRDEKTDFARKQANTREDAQAYRRRRVSVTPAAAGRRRGFRGVAPRKVLATEKTCSRGAPNDSLWSA